MAYFRIITLGCKVNQYESAYLNEELLKRGWYKAEKGQIADLVIVNTCIVTQRASHQSRQEIRRAIRENSGCKVIVTGCYAQVYPEELMNIDGIALIAGNTEKSKILEFIDKIFPSQKLLLLRDFSKKEAFEHLRICRFPDRSRAFLKIQDGCESFCSYCIVPYARGPYRSLDIKNVLLSIESLMENGYKEIVLTGIHLGKYGIDLKNTSLERLLKEIGKQRYPVRVRLSSIEPNEISMELLDIIAQEDWICKHLHIPLQSGDNRILKKMNRKYTREEFYSLIMEIHKRMPLAGIGTDVLVGFPGEDLRAHTNTISLIQDLPISYLHVFPYSDRPKTPAFYFKEKLSPDLIKQRAKEIRDIGKRKRIEFFKRCLGKTFTALVERGGKNGLFRGTTENYIPVLFPYDKDITGEPVRVMMQEIKENAILGSMT